MFKANPTPLTEHGSFESIVNAGTQERQKSTFKWVRRMLLTIVFLLTVLLLTLVLWLLNVIPTFAAIMGAVVFTSVATFIAGRLWEVNTR